MYSVKVSNYVHTALWIHVRRPTGSSSMKIIYLQFPFATVISAGSGKTAAGRARWICTASCVRTSTLAWTWPSARYRTVSTVLDCSGCWNACCNRLCSYWGHHWRIVVGRTGSMRWCCCLQIFQSGAFRQRWTTYRQKYAFYKAMRRLR